MDFIIKLLHTLFFGAISFIVFMKYNKSIFIKRQYIILLLVSLIVLFFLNTMYNIISNGLFFILLMFSLSIVILNVMKGFINMENSRILKSKNNLETNYKDIKTILFEKIIPVMIFLYQLLLIWYPVLFEKMSKK